MTPTNEAGHGLPEGIIERLAAAKDQLPRGSDERNAVWQAIEYLRKPETGALSRGVPEGIKDRSDEIGFDDGLDAPAAAGAQGEEYQRGYAQGVADTQKSPKYDSTGDTVYTQPAAADGGVRERAREIVSAVVSQEFRLTSKEAKQWWRYTGINAHESDALMIRCVEAALSSHRQAGEDGLPFDGKYGDVLLPFVVQMERELYANAGKGDRPGWLKMSPEIALLEIYYHVAKLQKAVKDDNGAGIIEYSADVANMSMMLLDICGGLANIDTHHRRSGSDVEDASRYRWLKDNCQNAPDEYGAAGQLYFGTYIGGQLDAAIDAARSGGGGSVVKFSDTDGWDYEIHQDPIP